MRCSFIIILLCVDFFFFFRCFGGLGDNLFVVALLRHGLSHHLMNGVDIGACRDKLKILLGGNAADIALLMVYLNGLLIDGDIYRKIHYEHDYVEICADAERAVGK